MGYFKLRINFANIFLEHLIDRDITKRNEITNQRKKCVQAHPYFIDDCVYLYGFRFFLP